MILAGALVLKETLVVNYFCFLAKFCNKAAINASILEEKTLKYIFIVIKRVQVDPTRLNGLH